MECALETEHLVKRYGRHTALDGLSIRVPRGCILGLVGSNGAGKTSLMSIAAGLVHKSSGRVDVLGGGDFEVGKHRGRVSILPQDSGLPYYARVGEVLHFYARAQGLDRAAARSGVDEVLEQVNLADRRRAKVRSLSHGMFRRLTVAQALLGRPDLIMLDEPMSGLDPREVANMREVLRGCRGRQTVMISSHILSEVETVCDEIAFVERGQTVRQDRLEAILRADLHVRYVLGRCPDVKALEAAVGVRARWVAAESTLDLELEQGVTPEEVNARVLPLLLAEDCPILEIRRGSNLEREYLEGHVDGG